MESMTSSVAAFIEWWESLTPAQRRQEIARGRERKSTWMARRSAVLFGLLETDSMFGALDTVELQLLLPKEEDA